MFYAYTRRMSNPLKGGIWTMEFWGLVGVLASSILTLVYVFGYVKPQDQESLTKAVTAVIAALGALMVQWGGYTAFNAGRVTVKSKAIDNGLVPQITEDDSNKIDPVKMLGNSKEVTFIFNGVTVCLSRP